MHARKFHTEQYVLCTKMAKVGENDGYRDG
jgi:hypothetical protein